MEFYPAKSPVLPRKTPMKVLVLGLPRTGTTSICAALKTLNIRPYHFNEISKNKNNKHFELWLELVKDKYDHPGKPPAVNERLETILWSYDAVTDDPCCLFVEELIAAYPNAKIILTTRKSPEVWLSSMRRFILEILAWRRSYLLLSWFDRQFTRPYIALLQRTTRVLTGGLPPGSDLAHAQMIRFYDEHSARVLREAGKEQRDVLVFEPSMGWEPLCDFLGVAVPGSAYPHLNSTTDALELEWDLYWQRWRVVTMSAAWTMAVPVLLGAAIVRWMTI